MVERLRKMVLTDSDIRNLNQFEDENINPASVDLTLNNVILVPRFTGLVDPREEQWYNEAYTDFVINPGQFVLGSTIETVKMGEGLAGQVHGKSSLGRLGLAIHVTAGWVDPGFMGKLTLEIVNHSANPILLSYGMRICQLVFHKLTGEAEKGYSGRYQGDETTIGSRYWKSGK